MHLSDNTACRYVHGRKLLGIAINRDPRTNTRGTLFFRTQEEKTNSSNVPFQRLDLREMVMVVER